MAKLRQYAFVRLTDKSKKFFAKYPENKEMLAEESFVFLGDIPNMPGHCILIGSTTGQHYIGYHPESFEELPEEET